MLHNFSIIKNSKSAKRFFVKMNGNFTNTFFSDHTRFVVAKTNFEFITCGTNIQHIAFPEPSRIKDDIFRFTTENLRDRILSASASASASKAISFF